MDHKPTQLTTRPETQAAQMLHKVDAETGAVVPPIHMASTFMRDEAYELMGDYVYSRYSNPTLEQAEAVISALEGAEICRVFNSGLSACVAVIDSLPVGAQLLAPQVMYHGGLEWMERQARRGQIRLALYDQADPGDLARQAALVSPDLIWIETPSNPTWDVIDIAAARRLAPQALIAVDATCAPPVTMRALALGADIAFHSATKYLNGHSDITAGALSYQADMPLAAEIDDLRKLQGTALQGFQAWLLIRGMRSLFPRFRTASAAALRIAQHFEHHPALEGVLYPGLESHPHHAIAKAQMQDGFGGMLSLLVSGDSATTRRVVTSAQVFMQATSLGGVESLIEHRIISEGDHPRSPDNLIRLSIGVEHVEDLIADLEQALEAVK